jgi:hypothetical protein
MGQMTRFKLGNAVPNKTLSRLQAGINTSLQ